MACVVGSGRRGIGAAMACVVGCGCLSEGAAMACVVGSGRCSDGAAMACRVGWERLGGGAAMTCEGGCSRRGGGAASDEKREGWRPVSARSSASRTSMAHDPAAGCRRRGRGGEALGRLWREKSSPAHRPCRAPARCGSRAAGADRGRPIAELRRWTLIVELWR
jgi:hypothetical protein